MLSDAVAAAVALRAREQRLQAEPLAETIERDNYTPALLGLLSNVLVWGGSRLFRSLHGVGTNEWRVISALGNHPGSTATTLCVVLGLNKSIASKSVNLLLEEGLAGYVGGKRGARYLFLTGRGVEMHDAILPIALERQRILHADLTADEITTLNALLLRMLDSADALQRYERSAMDSNTDADGANRSVEKAAPGA